MKIFKILISGFLAIAVVLSCLFIAALKVNYTLPIIMYHSVKPHAEPQNRLAVSVETFERQMDFLKTHRYNVLSLERAADLIQRRKIPPHSVVITFDDGYKDNFTYAYPVLKKYKFNVTMFIIINEVGRAQNDRLSWDQIREMQGSGLVVFGSHGLGPEPLINIKSEENLKKEIFDSRKILQDKLGRPVFTFSYPEGRFNDKIRQLVIAAGYKVAVATNPGKGHPRDDLFALKRIRISENAANMFVFWVETSGFYTFLKERRHK